MSKESRNYWYISGDYVYNPPPQDWVIVVVSRLRHDSGEMLEWLRAGNGIVGEWTWATDRWLDKEDRRNLHWAFEDRASAMLFKLRWG